MGCRMSTEFSRLVPFGLYDMHGNAGEWCSDWYKTDYDAESPREDPKGPDTGSAGVSRGGEWGTIPVSCRCADRNAAELTDCNGRVGFRVVRER